MANSYTSRLKKRLPATGDNNWDDEWHDNEKIDEVVQGALLSDNRVISGGAVTDGGGLAVDFSEAVVRLNGARLTVGAASFVMTADQANWLYIDAAGEVVTSLTPPAGDYIPMAMVDTDSVGILRIADLRPMGQARKPFVIFSTGQSNMTSGWPYDWTPAPNLHVWNFDAHVQPSTDVGTGFIPVSTTTIGPSLAAGHKIAMEHPDADVYVINIARGGMGLINWSSTPVADPDGYNFREAITGNVPVALASIGVSEIDYCVWGGAETDALAQSLTIAANMEGYLYNWLVLQSWYPINTRMAVMAMSPYVASVPGNGDFLLKRFNGSLRSFVAARPYIRDYIDCDDMPITLYDSTGGIPYIHKTGAGHYHAGLRVGDTILRGAGIVPYLNRENVDGQYTPVVTNKVNCNVAIGYALWSRVGNIITVNISLVITRTVGGTASFDLNVPVKTKYPYPQTVVGAAVSVLGAGVIVGVPGSQTVRVYAANAVSAADTASVSFMYRVYDCDILPNSP
jgi:hypothetical protein